MENVNIVELRIVYSNVFFGETSKLHINDVILLIHVTHMQIYKGSFYSHDNMEACVNGRLCTIFQIITCEKHQLKLLII
jgi:hypothetical protein